MCLSRARLRSGRSIAVHRAAKDAAQVPMLLYGPEGIYRSRLFLSQTEGQKRGRMDGGWIFLDVYSIMSSIEGGFLRDD